MKNKTFHIPKEEIKNLIEHMGGCIATDYITVHGHKVGYMYREQPCNDIDTGWRFLSGYEDQAYMDNADNHAFYEVNTIANYDSDIIPFLQNPIGSSFERRSPNSSIEPITKD